MKKLGDQTATQTGRATQEVAGRWPRSVAKLCDASPSRDPMGRYDTLFEHRRHADTAETAFPWR